MMNPQREPFVKATQQYGFPKNANFIFQGPVANDVFTDHDQPVAAKSVGELVKSRAAMFGGT